MKRMNERFDRHKNIGVMLQFLLLKLFYKCNYSVTRRSFSTLLQLYTTIVKNGF